MLTVNQKHPKSKYFSWLGLNYDKNHDNKNNNNKNNNNKNNNNNNSEIKTTSGVVVSDFNSCRNMNDPNNKRYGVQEETYDQLFNTTRALYNKGVKEKNSAPLVILLYNKGYTRNTEPFYPNKYPFGAGLMDEKCSSNCLFVRDNRLLSCADLVIAHHSWNGSDTNHLGWLRKQRSDVPFAWYEMESPLWSVGHRRLKGLFDLTLTYDRDSEITVPYSIVYPKNSKLDMPVADDQQPNAYPVDHAKNKTKMVLALISNCVGYRNSFIKELKKYVQLDNFGRCSGNAKSCPRFTQECDQKIRQYKFYLALENSFCEDYHTEKVYDNGLTKGLVPITMTMTETNTDESYLGKMKLRRHKTMVAPPKSFINILDFPNMKSLADYLKYLDKNDTAYNEYHAWRKDYKTRSPTQCQICQMITDTNIKSKVNKENPATVDIEKFWNKGNKCIDYGHEIFQKYLK